MFHRYPFEFLWATSTLGSLGMLGDLRRHRDSIDHEVSSEDDCAGNVLRHDCWSLDDYPFRLFISERDRIVQPYAKISLNPQSHGNVDQQRWQSL